MPWRLSARGSAGDGGAPSGASSGQLGHRLPNLLRQDSWRTRLWLAWLVWMTLGILLSTGLARDRLVLEEGQVAPEDVPAPRALVDRPATERLRRQAAAEVQPSYVRNPEAASRAMRDLAAAFEQVWAVRGRTGMDGPARLAALRRAVPLDLGDASYEAVLAAGDDVLTAMERDAADVIRRQMGRNIAPGDLDTFRKEAVAEIRALDHPRPLADFLAKVTESAIRPNFFIDPARTRRQMEAAMNAVPPVTIVPGEIIVRKGQRVSAEDLVRLRDAGMLGRPGDWRETVGAFLLSGLLVSLAAAFLYLFRPDLFASTPRLLLLAIIGLGAAMLTRVLWPISGYLAPVGGAAMLLTILLDPMVAVLAVALLGVLTGLLTGNDPAVVFVGVAGGLVGVLGVARAGQRSDIMRAGFLVALADITAIAGLHLSFSTSLGFDVADLGRSVLAGAANGILLAGVLTLGSLPYFENAFGVLTSLRLLELSNPNQPLLRRLLLEAPGTYHHSLLVANLAEAGAEAVGANGLLARVGAYYHDVGKIKRPYFFVENQFGAQNPHDKLSPHLSALIVTAHVKEGVELARQHRLPEEIVRFIPEHHGTGLVAYFYQRALAAGDGDVDESGFRHLGPVPQSRETAIVMLADAAEAAVRALPRPTPGRVQAAVRRVIKARLEDDQLNQCDLTLRDLDKIAEAFTQVLSGVFHARVEYPGAADAAGATGAGQAAAGGTAVNGAPVGGAAAGDTADPDRSGQGGRPTSGGAVQRKRGA